MGHLRVSVRVLELVSNVALGEERAGLRVEDGALADTAVRASDEHERGRWMYMCQSESPSLHSTWYAHCPSSANFWRSVGSSFAMFALNCWFPAARTSKPETVAFVAPSARRAYVADCSRPTMWSSRARWIGWAKTEETAIKAKRTRLACIVEIKIKD